jgi:hypothetical protein
VYSTKVRLTQNTNAVTNKSIFVKLSSMLKAKELRSSAVNAFRVNILPKLNLLSAEKGRNHSAGVVNAKFVI